MKPLSSPWLFILENNSISLGVSQESLQDREGIFTKWERKLLLKTFLNHFCEVLFNKTSKHTLHNFALSVISLESFVESATHQESQLARVGERSKCMYRSRLLSHFGGESRRVCEGFWITFQEYIWNLLDE